MAEDKKVRMPDPAVIYCATPGCDFKERRGVPLKKCRKCEGRRFVTDTQKEAIEAAFKAAQRSKPDDADEAEPVSAA